MPIVDDSLKISHLELADRVEAENRAGGAAGWPKKPPSPTRCPTPSISIAASSTTPIGPSAAKSNRPKTRAGRTQAIYDADQTFTSAKLEEARDLYVEGFKKWRQVLDDNPALMDASITDELVDSIDHYRNVLGQLDETFPKPFVLQNVLDAHNVFRGRGVPQEDEQDSEASAADNDPSNPTP